MTTQVILKYLPSVIYKRISLKISLRIDFKNSLLSSLFTQKDTDTFTLSFSCVVSVASLEDKILFKNLFSKILGSSQRVSGLWVVGTQDYDLNYSSIIYDFTSGIP